MLVKTLSAEQIEQSKFLTVIVPARKLMKGRPSGGITLALSQSIRENYTVIHKTDQVFAIVYKRPKNAIIVSYFQPKFEIEVLFQEVADALSKADLDYHIVSLGDFNCSFDIPIEKQGTLCDILQDNSLICWNTPEVPTDISHNGISTKDLLFTKEADSLIDCELKDCPLFKHSQISGKITGTLTKRTKLCPTIRKCDLKRLANNLEGLRKRVGVYTFENVNDEALCVVSGIRGCITRATSQPTEQKYQAVFTSKHYELNRNVKTAFKRYRNNPILTNAKFLIDA